MKDYIVDASVVAKWLLPEADHDLAKVLIDAPCVLRAPDLIMPEFANVLLKRILRKELTSKECNELSRRFMNEYLDNRVRVIPSRLLAERALQIARMERLSVYDGLYLALAVQARCELVTADEKLVRAVKNKALKPHLLSLKDLRLEMNPVSGPSES